MRRLVMRSPMRSLYAKIFLWFCATIVMTTVVVLVVASLTGSQPFGRRWMAVTQDLYARSAVDFYRTGGREGLARYLDALAAGSGIRGQLLDGAGSDVLGQPVSQDAAGVLALVRESGESRFRLGRVWTAASPVEDRGTHYTFVMEVYPARGFFDGTFANTMVPRLALGVLLIAVFCLMLARHITRPILMLEDAATQLAAGELSVRAGPKMAPRRDELARMAAAFDRMAERIQGLILAQQEMLGHISHELRSPLTRMGVSLELLRRGGTAAGESAQIDQMQVDLDRLNQMIGEILQITRMDLQGAAAGQQVAHAGVVLGSMLEAIARDAAFEAQTREKHVALEIDAECIVLGDEAMLRSCCENVVRNALLYTPDGTAIRIELTRMGDAAVIAIEDDGPGVPEDAVPHLFELFYRVGDAPERHPDGTGFGLAIAQRIVGLHGGRIEARNRLPHGLAVTITLPLA